MNHEHHSHHKHKQPEHAGTTAHDHAAHHESMKKMAASATLHCLIGCAIGEMIGVTIGTHFEWQPHQTVVFAAILSFLSGYTVSTWPLIRAGLPFLKALRVVLAADTVSILTMTIVDNILMLTIPGAMDKNLLHPVYWLSRSLSLIAAFAAAYPVNLYLLKRGKGHALMHQYHGAKPKQASKKRTLVFAAVVLLIALVISGVVYVMNTWVASKTFSTATAGLSEAKDPVAVTLKNGDTYDLTLEPVTRVIDGKSVRLLGYNGAVPGPTLYVEQGSAVTLKVTNKIDVDTTLHPHGINGDNQADGLPGITQEPIKYGETYTQTLRFPDAGVYWYHPHIREDYTQASGLYANIIVKPKDVSAWPTVSGEQVLTLSDIALTNDGILPYSKTTVDHTLMGRFGTVELINGRSDYTANVKQGDVVRYYLTNTASTQVFRFALPGAKLKLIGADNGLYEQETFVDTVTLGPAERAIVDAYYPAAGTFTMQNRAPEKTITLGRVTVTPSDASDANIVDRFNTAAAHPEVSSDVASYRSRENAATKKRLAITLNMDMALMHEGMNMSGGMMDMGGMHMMGGRAATGLSGAIRWLL